MFKVHTHLQSKKREMRERERDGWDGREEIEDRKGERDKERENKSIKLFITHLRVDTIIIVFKLFPDRPYIYLL